jgi:hypothetical protein
LTSEGNTTNSGAGVGVAGGLGVGSGAEVWVGDGVLVCTGVLVGVGLGDADVAGEDVGCCVAGLSVGRSTSAKDASSKSAVASPLSAGRNIRRIAAVRAPAGASSGSVWRRAKLFAFREIVRVESSVAIASPLPSSVPYQDTRKKTWPGVGLFCIAYAAPW